MRILITGAGGHLGRELVRAGWAPEADVIAWCRERLTAYKCPRTVDIVDSIGRNTMGKINKRRLRDAYLAGELA